ncbi:MAG: hypothetical protein IJP27_00600 [Clostridia bacterium]|nr:hypothetical protein [Clostridia bacterium]
MKKCNLAALIILLLLPVSGCAKPATPQSAGGEQATEPTVYQSSEQAISTEQRALYFDLARNYRFDHLPDFQEGDVLSADDLRWYACAFAPDQVVQTEKGSFVPTETYQKIAPLFGIQPPDRPIQLEIGSYGGFPFMELISFQKEKNIITVELKKHYFYELDSVARQETATFIYDPTLEYYPNTDSAWNLMEAEKLTLFEAAKALVLRGQVPEQPSTTKKITYETEDGITPTRFLSARTFYWEEKSGRYVAY